MSLNALDFLRAILPETGFYISWTKLKSRSFNTVLRSIEELCRFILDEDAKGHTVYHACSSYQDARGVWNARRNKFEQRCQGNVLGVRALWMDIDGGFEAVRKGTGYASTVECAQAIVGFCAAFNLPQPLYVSSGSGVHIYFPLVETLTEPQWVHYAKALKAAATRWGLKHDPARTTDSASVLRTPYTNNRKYVPPALVFAGDAVQASHVAIFDHLISGAAGAPNSGAGGASGLPREAAPSRVTQALLRYDGPPAYSEKIANACAHIAALRDTFGNLPEPLWYAGLGVLAWCEDGEKFAHDWSSGFPHYTYEETAGKLQRARELTGATTCAKFESLDHGKCAACVHRGKIKSPISLGIQITASSVQTPLFTASMGVSDGNFTLAATSLTCSASRTLSGVQLPPLLRPYKWGEKNQLVLEYEAQEKVFDLLVSENPIFLEGVQTGELNHHRFSYHFKQYLPLEGWIDIHVDAEHLLGPGGIGKLFGRGAVIHEPKAFIQYVQAAVDEFNRTRKLRMRYEQFGWKEGGNAFLLGERLYRSDGIETIIGTDEIKTRAQFMEPAKTGSLEQWSAAANALFQLGCEAQSFALLCSFASVFSPFHSSNEGGAIVHLVSNASGTGKTTALAGVASVWGDGRALALTNIDTSVAKAITLGTLGNLPVVYDEMWDRDPAVIRDFVMTFTNGRDKLRGTREGDIRHVQASWQTLLISASNMSLVELLHGYSGIDAPGMRVVEFPLILPDHIKHATGDRLRKALEANAGHAGDVYLRYLMQADVRAWAQQALLQWTQDIWDRTKLRSEHRFWVRTLGSVATAASLVTQLGILSFQPSRIVEWAISTLTERKDEATQYAPDAKAVKLSEFLAEHITDTLVVAEARQPGDRRRDLAMLKPTRRLLIRYELKPGRIFIQETFFRHWLLKHGLNARETFNNLRDNHVLLGQRAITLSAGTEFPGGQVRCLEVNALHPMLGGAIAEITSFQAVRQPLQARVQT